jgi:16S rRNA (guanine966-N2)-methyltransferase
MIEKHIRVIAGLAKGRKLWGPKNRDIRPLTGIAKEYLFNVLQDLIPGSLILDLFAGTGSIGIEAISRGARAVTFVDDGDEAGDLLRRNIKELKIEGQATLISEDAIQFLTGSRRQGKPFDLIFADPPFNYIFMNELMTAIGATTLLKKEGYVIIHYSKDFHDRISAAGLQEIKYKTFGASRISIFQRGESVEASNLSGNV